MGATEATTSSEFDGVVADLQTNLSLIFARARVQWKDAATRIHPDLQVAGYKLLTFIDHRGAANAHELADQFEIDKSVISRQVRCLETLGLIESRADERDGRLRVLTATAHARQLLADMRVGNASRVREAIGELSTDEIRAASAVFRKLAQA